VHEGDCRDWAPSRQP